MHLPTTLRLHSPSGPNKKSQSISRVLSWTIIHLRQASPLACSDLPESTAGRSSGFLFGLAPSGVYHRHACYQPRGALLPHLFTLTAVPFPTAEAVHFLLHFPWAHTPQALPGTLPFGARTFLRAMRSDRLTNSAAKVNEKQGTRTAPSF